MKIMKKDLNLENAIEKEWIITNGIGGYCSSTILGVNTRRYHGLLIAPTNPPHNRTLILSKLDESIFINDMNYDLFTNICSNYISNGYKYLENFEKNPLPEFTYKIEKVKVNKKISMVYEHNTVVVKYSVKNDNNSEIKMTIAPIMNFRSFHNMTNNHEFSLKQNINEKNIQLSIDDSTPIYLYSTEGEYTELFDDKFKRMYYLKEEQRGFESEEDLCVPGIFKICVPAKKKIEFTIIASLEENIEKINADQIFEEETKRLENIVKNTKLITSKAKQTLKEKNKNNFIKDLIIASDSFIINRTEENLHSVIAGFPWFLDWGRDTAISFEGMFLLTKRYDLAKEILLFLVKNIKCGLVPNGYSEITGEPLYNSADSSLLLFEQVNKYLKYTKNYEFIKENIYEKLKDIIEKYEKGIDLDNNNIFIDEDRLLSSGTELTQNTWMDAKIGNIPVTPRNGKTVELNSLWYNALKTMENLAKKFEDKELSDKYKKQAMEHQKVFEEKFYNQSKKCLYDVLGDAKIRPNQLFSISTTYPVISPSSKIGKEIFETVKKKLLTKYGLRTLAKYEIGYCIEYRGDSVKRDKSYHQGTIWVWLLGLYFDSLNNIIDFEKDRIEKEKYIIEKEKFTNSVYNTFIKELYKGECIGNISEVYDAEKPFKPGGAFAQSWSVSEILKVVLSIDDEE